MHLRLWVSLLYSLSGEISELFPLLHLTSTCLTKRQPACYSWGVDLEEAPSCFKSCCAGQLFISKPLLQLNAIRCEIENWKDINKMDFCFFTYEATQLAWRNQHSFKPCKYWFLNNSLLYSNLYCQQFLLNREVV